MANRRQMRQFNIFGYALALPILVGMLWFLQARPAATPDESAEPRRDGEMPADRADLGAPPDTGRTYRDERAAFQKYLRFQENATVDRERHAGTVSWKVFDRGPSKDQEDPDGFREAPTREEAESTRKLMFPDSPTARYVHTQNAVYDEIWRGTADTGHDIEVYWNRGKFVVWFKLGKNDFTQDGNRLLTGDRHWFEMSVR